MMVEDQAAVAADAIETNPEGGPSHNVPLGTLVLRAGLLPLEAIEESLREAIKLWERGEELYKLCVGRLDAAHGKIEELARRVESAQP